MSWTCHPIEHELSAIYDITHGLGLAIITPKWMRYILDESTAFRFRDYGVNVFSLDASLPEMEAAEKAIECTEDFLYNKLGLASALSAVGIDDANFEVMARKACFAGGTLPGFKTLSVEDVVNILKMSL